MRVIVVVTEIGKLEEAMNRHPSPSLEEIEVALDLGNGTGRHVVALLKPMNVQRKLDATRFGPPRWVFSIEWAQHMHPAVLRTLFFPPEDTMELTTEVVDIS